MKEVSRSGKKLMIVRNDKRLLNLVSCRSLTILAFIDFYSLIVIGERRVSERKRLG
jgi:hypothetical protein